jgi:hypothetical protein
MGISDLKPGQSVKIFGTQTAIQITKIIFK